MEEGLALNLIQVFGGEFKNKGTDLYLCCQIFPSVEVFFLYRHREKTECSPCIHVDRPNTGVIYGIMQLSGKERFTGYYYCSFAPVANLRFPIETACDRESNRF